MRQIKIIDRSQDERFMREALALASEGAALGEVPVGAELEQDGEIIGRGFNCPISGNDPSAHAEMVAIRQQIRTEALIQPGLLDRTPHLLPIVVQLGRCRVLPPLQIGQQHPAALPIHLGDQAPVTAPLLLMQLLKVKHQVLDLLKSHLGFLLPSTSCQYKKTPLPPQIKTVVFFYKKKR